MTLITHPTMPGSSVDVPDSSLPFHQAAGWVVKGSTDDPEIKAAAEAQAEVNKGRGGGSTEQDTTPKRRTTKDSED